MTPTVLGNCAFTTNLNSVFFDYLAWRTDGGYEALAVQGLEYPATYLDYWFSRYKKGIKETLRQLRARRERCPNTKFILSGYSQGAEVVREAAKLLTDEETAFVKIVVLFGDPDKLEDGPSGSVRPPVGKIDNHNVLEVCHPLDVICHGHWIPKRDHRDYFLYDGETVADWIVRHLSIQRNFTARSNTPTVIRAVIPDGMGET